MPGGPHTPQNLTGEHRAADPQAPSVPPARTAPPFAPPAPVAAPNAPAPGPAPAPAPAVTATPRPAIPGRRTLDDEVASAVKGVLGYEPELALIAVARVRGHGLTAEQTVKADELEAWAWLQRGDTTEARALIEAMPADADALPYLRAGLALIEQGHTPVIDSADQSMSARFLATVVALTAQQPPDSERPSSG